MKGKNLLLPVRILKKVSFLLDFLITREVAQKKKIPLPLVIIQVGSRRELFQYQESSFTYNSC